MNLYGLIRLVGKPVLQKTNDKGVSVSTFTGVYNEQRKVGDKYVEDPHFLEFVIWDKAAEFVCDRFNQGDLIYIESATPRQRKWVDDDGNKRSKIVFRINNFRRVSQPKNREETVSIETKE